MINHFMELLYYGITILLFTFYGITILWNYYFIIYILWIYHFMDLPFYGFTIFMITNNVSSRKSEYFKTIYICVSVYKLS